MKKNNIKKIVSVHWLDARVYAGSSISNLKIVPTRMTTRGILFKKVSNGNKGIYIKSPRTIYEQTGKKVLKQKGATFLFIPRGMITRMRILKKRK